MSEALYLLAGAAIGTALVLVPYIVIRLHRQRSRARALGDSTDMFTTDYWLKYRGCPIVYGTAPGFQAPEGPCWYCGKDHHHRKADEEAK